MHPKLRAIAGSNDLRPGISEQIVRQKPERAGTRGIEHDLYDLAPIPFTHERHSVSTWLEICPNGSTRGREGCCYRPVSFEFEADIRNSQVSLIADIANQHVSLDSVNLGDKAEIE
jgi:hypothetical protein